MPDGKRKILVVDDDPDVISALTTILESGGYTVVSAPNGTIGMQKALSEKPDLMIIDIVMDTYSEGFILITNLLANPATKNIPNIILTSLGLQQELDMICPAELGTKNILQKPVAPDVLIRTVQAVIKG